MGADVIEEKNENLKIGLDIETIDDSMVRNYKIIEYFKEEPTRLVTVITLLVTIFTVVLGFIAISIQKHYLSYWNISTDIVEYNTAILMRQLCVSIVIFLGDVICITLLNIFYAKYFKDQIHKIQKSYAYKVCERNYNVVKLKCRILNVVIFFLNRTTVFNKSRFWKKIFIKCKEMLKSNTASVRSLKQQLEKAESLSNYTGDIGALFKLILKLLVLGFFMFFLLYFTTMYLVSDGSYIVKSILLTIATMIFYSILVYLGAKKKVPKKKIKNTVDKYFNGEEWKVVEYSNEYNKNNVKEFFTDSILICNIVLLVVLLVCFLFYFSIINIQKIEEQKTFHTVEYQESTYVVLHTFDNKFVLEKAEISVDSETKEKQIVVDISGNTIVGVEGLTIYSQEYDVVKQKT